MKKSSFLQGAVVASLSLILVKLIGVVYVIPFNAIIGEDGGALYSFGYNIYAVFLSISTAGVPFAMSKVIGEYNALGYEDAKNTAYRLGRNILLGVSVAAFLTMFIFAKPFAYFMIGDDTVTVSVEDVTFVIRCISFAILVIPFLSVTKGYLQGHKFITPISASQIYEQVVRVAIILLGSYLTMIVLDLGLTITVGISMFGASVGGLVAAIYLKRKIVKGKEHFLCENKVVDAQISNKQIIKKIFTYAVPFIITSVISNLYVFADMVLVVRTMGEILNYSPEVTTSVTAVYSTWASKLMLIVFSFSVGISLSLLPNVVDSYARGDIKDISNKFNKALQMILILIVPLTIFISIFAEEVWVMFYGQSEYGPEVLKVYVYVAIVNSLYILVTDITQGMNKFKLVYIAAGLGLGLNILLDIPLMILMEKLGVQVVYGAIFATIISMSIAFLVVIIHFAKKERFEYKETGKLAPKIAIAILVFIVTALLAKEFIHFDSEGRLIQIAALGVYGIITFAVYGLVCYFTGILKVVIGEEGIKLRRKKSK